MRRLPIASCSEDWNAMTGDDRVRRCAACDCDVVTIAAETVDVAPGTCVRVIGALAVGAALGLAVVAAMPVPHHEEPGMWIEHRHQYLGKYEGFRPTHCTRNDPADEPKPPRFD